MPCLLLSIALIIIALLPASPALPSPTSHLTRRSELSVERRLEDVLVSRSGVFSCGFFQVGNNAFTFSIWFTPTTDTDNPTRADVVWSANRDRPVSGGRSRVLLRGRNLLVLIDGYDDSVVWSAATTTSSNGPLPSSSTALAEIAELLDTGNLVLRNSGDRILWQSFDFPTDTIIPGQPLTKNARLTSSNSTSSLSTRSFVFYFDNDNVLRLTYDGPDISSIYWPNPDYNVWDNGRTIYNSSRYAVLDQAGTFTSSDRLNFNATDNHLPVGAVCRRLTLDPDGNLRLYSRRTNYNNNEEKKNQWYVTWQAMMVEPKIHGLCGRNGICTYGLEPTCTCPPGYRKTSRSSWRDGCKPVFTSARPNGDNNYFCSNRSNNGSYQFVHVPHADFYGYDLDFKKNVSLAFCRSVCEQDCNCKAFVYRQTGQGFCYPKAALFNGYSYPEFPGSLFIKLPSDFRVSEAASLIDPNSKVPREHLDCSANASMTPDYYYGGGSGTTSRFKRAPAYGYIFVATFGVVEFLFITMGWWFIYKRGNPDKSIVYSMEAAGHDGGYQYKHAISNHFRIFSYHEIKRATSNFKHLVGEGGSGKVYKGVLHDKRIVAVKRLFNAEKGTQGDEEFRAELNVIGQIYHMNLVRMWGFCVQSSHRFLIYEYVENGSLARALFSPPLEDDSDSNKSNMDARTTHTVTSSHGLLQQENALNWSRRFGIALGIARGLAYLHNECLEWIIHCDIKPENILLDATYQPKIADFGLAKLTQRDKIGSHLSKIRGTKGYMAPEWTSNVPITTKVDVYSYGVIVLELLRGNRLPSWGSITHKSSTNSNDTVGNQLELPVLAQLLKERLVDAKNKLQEEGKEPTSLSIMVGEFVDPKLRGDFNPKQAQVLLEIALLCIEADRNKRPSMDYVVQMLLNCYQAKFDAPDSD